MNGSTAMGRPILARQRYRARLAGLKKGEITKDRIARILPHIVLIRIDITPAKQRLQRLSVG